MPRPRPRYNPWTDADVAALAAMVAAGLRDNTIAELMRRTLESIRQRRRRLLGEIPRGR